MTNGKKVYDINGNTVYKEFCDKDWTAIKRFKVLGVEVMFLSGDNFNAMIARDRNIPFYHNALPKIAYLSQICQQFNVTKDEILYVGDDLFDLEIAQAIKYPYCPKDAIWELREICTIIADDGGNNVIMHLYNDLSYEKLIPEWNNEVHLKKLYELDNKEYKAP